MSNYYDKDGTPLELLDWARKLEQEGYSRVNETTLYDGTWISTVWLGLDHQHSSGPPVIFETMAFSSRDSFDDQDMERYTTLAEALEGHERMVTKWRIR